MGNYKDRVEKPIDRVTGLLIGDDLLDRVKLAMLNQGVFRKLFGEKGERIFVEALPNFNDTIIPTIEMHWKGERWESHDTRLRGTIVGMIVLPADMAARTDRFRAIAACFARWIESDHGLFTPSYATEQTDTSVSGLIEFGTNIEFKYDSAIRAGGTDYPVIDFTLPVVFDLTIFKAENPDVDLNAALDAGLVGWIETYGLKITDEKGDVLIDTNVLCKTGQTQDG